MAALRRFVRRLLNAFRPASAEPDLAREIEAHLQLLSDDLERCGLDGDAARSAAKRAFDGVEQTKDRHRDARSYAWLDGVWWDVRYALRQLHQHPGFTAVAVAMLAVGIGVNAAVFTVTNGVLFKGFPSVVENDRVVYLDSPRTETGCCLSYPDFEDWRTQATSFEDIAIANGLDLTLNDTTGLPETLYAVQVSTNAFKLIGQRPILGRDFTTSDEAPGATHVAILSYALWERRYGKDPAIVGRTIRMGGIPAGSVSFRHASSVLTPTTVVGVMAPGVSFPFKETLWVPLVPTAMLQRREARGLWFAFGRLADGATIDSARIEMETIGHRLASSYPSTNQGIRPRVRTFKEAWAGPNATLIYGSLWGAVGFVLLIACANVANLLLVRATSRSREMTVRIALGAGRWRIVRQLLIESVLLSAMAGIAGWWLAAWSVRAYAVAEGLGTNFDYAMDGRVLGYLVAISIGTGVLFGLAPASRLSSLDVNGALKDGGRGATGARGRRLSALLVIAEMALAVVLLTGAGVMIRSFLTVYTADLGVTTTDVFTIGVNLPTEKYPSAEAQIAFYDRLKPRLEAIPGVESITFSNTIPTWGALTLPYELPGAPLVDEQRRPTLSALIVASGYFRTMGAAVLAGREFTDADVASGVPVVIVNQRFAATIWPGEAPLGKRLRLFDGATPEVWLTVVGVVSNIVQNDRTGRRTDPLIYVPYRQKPRNGMTVLARTRVPPGTLGTAFRREIQEMDADVPIIGVATLAARIASNYGSNRRNGALFVIFAAIALLLASIGLYAVVAHSASQRTQEIGIRTAMGARSRDIVALVLRQGMLPVSIGLAAGLAMAFAVMPFLRSQLVGVSPIDSISFAAASGVLALAAMLGCWIPARRAARVDPVIALRAE